MIGGHTTGDLLRAIIPFFIFGLFTNVFIVMVRAVFCTFSKLILSFWELLSSPVFMYTPYKISRKQVKYPLKGIICFPIFLLYGLIFTLLSYYYLDGVVRVVSVFMYFLGISSSELLIRKLFFKLMEVVNLVITLIVLGPIKFIIRCKMWMVRKVLIN